MTGRTFIALFSGINVGGNRIVKMAELRPFLEGFGLSNVATYVQSGNAVFQADTANAAALGASLEKAFAERWGFHSRILLRDLMWLRALVTDNPFPEIADDPTKLHVFALERVPTADEIARLSARDTFGDRWRDQSATCSTCTHANGYGKSKFAGGLARWLKVPATARNWRTMLTLLRLAEAA